MDNPVSAQINQNTQPKKTALLVGGVFAVGVFLIAAVVAILSIGDNNISVRDAQVTNVTDTAFTLTWISDSPYVGSVVYHEGTGWPMLFAQAGKSIAYDDRDVQLDKEGNYVAVEAGPRERFTHHVTIRNLKPETEYSFRIGGRINGKDAEITKAKTRVLIEDIKTPDPGYGKLVNIDASDTLLSFVTTTQTNTAIFSTYAAENSTYSIDLTNLFGENQVKITDLTARIRSGKELDALHRFTQMSSKPFETIRVTTRQAEVNPLGKLSISPISASGNSSCNILGDMNIRSSSSLDADVNKSVRSGDVVVVSGSAIPSGGYNWSQVTEVNGVPHTGWIAMTNRIQCSTGPLPANSCSVTGALNIRTSPDASNDNNISRGISAGARITYLSSEQRSDGRIWLKLRSITDAGSANWDVAGGSPAELWAAQTGRLNCSAVPGAVPAAESPAAPEQPDTQSPDTELWSTNWSEFYSVATTIYSSCSAVTQLLPELDEATNSAVLGIIQNQQVATLDELDLTSLGLQAASVEATKDILENGLAAQILDACTEGAAAAAITVAELPVDSSQANPIEVNKQILLARFKANGSGRENFTYESMVERYRQGGDLNDLVYQELLTLDAWLSVSSDSALGSGGLLNLCRSSLRDTTATDYDCMKMLAYLGEFRFLLGNRFSYDPASGSLTTPLPTSTGLAARFFSANARRAFNAMYIIDSTFRSRYRAIEAQNPGVFQNGTDLNAAGVFKAQLFSLEYYEGYKALSSNLARGSTRDQYSRTIREFLSDTDRARSLFYYLKVFFNSPRAQSTTLSSSPAVNINRGFFYYSGGSVEANRIVDMQNQGVFSGDVTYAEPFGSDWLTFVSSGTNTTQSTSERRSLIDQTIADIIPGEGLNQVASVPIPPGGSAMYKFEGPVYKVSASAASSNPSLEVTESGRYAFFRDGERVAEQDIIVSEGNVKIWLYNDLNGNRNRDENEEYLSDYTQISIAKDATAEEFNLTSGWNLIHLPLIDTRTDGNVDSAGELIDYWNGQGADIKHVARYRNGQFQMFSKRESGTEYATDFDLIPGEGLFILNLTTNTNVTFSGNRFESSVPVKLNQGWNLVGVMAPGQSLKSEDVLKKAQSQGFTADTISQFEGGTYQSVISKDETIFGNNFNIVDKRGYFIRVESGGGRSFDPGK